MKKTKLETGSSKLDTAGSRIARFPFFVFRYSIFVFSALWRWLREVSGDDAYERYEATHSDAVSRLSPREFYRQRMERKFSGPCRCC